MDSRSILRWISPWVWMVCVLMASAGLGAEALPTSCQETSERVLKPFLDRLETAQEAARQYEKQNAEKIKAINEQILLRYEAEAIFDDAKAKKDAEFGDRIVWAREAIQEARADAQKRIGEQRRLAAADRENGRDHQAEAHTAAAAKIAADLAAGKIHWRKEELRLTRDLNGWREYITWQTQERAKVTAAYAAGEVHHHIPKLRHGATWEELLQSIEQKRRELGKAQRRQYSFRLDAIRRSCTGEEIDDYVAGRRAELGDAEARIAAGTFSVFVPVLKRSIDRNGVQKLVAEARNKYRKTVNAWADKTYSNYNPILRAHYTNGRIEEVITEKQQELADFQSAGDDARVFTLGAHRTAREIRRQLAGAQADVDSDRVKRYQEALAAWGRARAEWIAKKQEDIRHWEGILAKHKEVHQEDLDKQMADIEGRLQDALDQTPCGGADPTLDVVTRHRERVAQLTESDAERQRHLSLYDDKIYIEPGGAVHGDPCDAWYNAVRDTGVSRRDPNRTPPPQTFGESLSSFLLQAKNDADYAKALFDAGGAALSIRTIEDFITKIEKLDINAMKNRDFYAQRREIRKLLPKVTEALEKGPLSPDQIRRYIEALKKSGSGTTQTRAQLKAMQTLLDKAQAARSYVRSGALRSIGRTLATDAAASYRTFVKGSATEIARRLDTYRAKMTKLDRGLLILSVAAAGAEAYDLMNKDMAAEEAIARSSVNFAIDLAIAGVPIAAAAEIGTQIMFGSYAYASGDKGVSDATLSNTAKQVAEAALDRVATGGAYLGEGSIALERVVFNEPNIGEILGNVSYDRLRQSLSQVEDELAAVPPGDPDEKRLLRMREAFRILIRAKQQQG